MDVNPIEITEIERPLRNEQPVRLQSEVWHLMRQHAVAMQAAREDAGRKQADEHGRFQALVIDLARAHHQLRVFLERSTAVLEGAGLQKQASLLATIRDRYEHVLKRAGAELVYPDHGRPFTRGSEDLVKVVAWVSSEDVDQMQVRETVSPGVKVNSELVCQAEVEVAVPVLPARTGQRSAPTAGPNDAPQEGDR